MQDATAIFQPPHAYLYTRVLRSDEKQAQGNTKIRSDFSTNTLTSLAALKAAFDNVMRMLPEAYPFGKGGYTNVSKTLMEEAIEDFITLKNGKKIPSLTIDDRNALILALRKLILAREAWKSAKNKKTNPTRASRAKS